MIGDHKHIVGSEVTQPMAPKRKGSGKKKKGPPLCTTEEDTAPFGFKVGDIVRTPLGITGTVIGVKYEDPNQKESGRLWVKYENGHEAPLEPKLGAGYMVALGYRRCSEADHIKRDVDNHTADLKKIEKERSVVEEILRLTQQGLPIPESLLPPKKAPKKPKGDKKKK